MDGLLESGLLKFLQTLLFLRKLTYKLFPSYLEKSVKATFDKYGITIGGSRPWDIQVHNPAFYVRVALNTSMGFGEAYMDGWWTPNNLEEFFNKCTREQKKPRRRSHRGGGRFFRNFTLRRFFYFLNYKVFNLQSKLRAWEVAEKHYDLGNDLYELMLDSTMNYSCAYWKDAKTLEQAQINKMELIAQKLKLEPGMKVLDLGCGWGPMAKHLATNHGVQVIGCTVSKEQAEWAQKKCQGLPVQIKLMDYRDLVKEVKGSFDRVVAVGLLEHVGEKNYAEFFKAAASALKEDGLFVCHMIGVSHPNVTLIDPWTEKYIFPNGSLPYHTHVTKYIDGVFILEDWHNLGFHYSKTLEGWISNFERSWPQLEHKFGDRFYKMWRYYLYGCAAAFRQRNVQLWQIVLSKNGHPGGYESVR